MPITTDNIPDLIKTTLEHFVERGSIEAVYKYRDYHFINEVFTKDKTVVQSGKSIKWNITIANNGSAKFSSLYEQDSTLNKPSVVREGEQRWCYADARASYERREIMQNSQPSQIREYLKTQRIAANGSLADLIEQRSVLAPNSPNDRKNPDGLAVALCMADAGVEDYLGGFNGRTVRYGNGQTSTTTYGIDRSVEPLFRNWVANHNGMGLQLCDTVRRGMIFTNFKAPMTFRDMISKKGPKYRALMSEYMYADFLRLVNSGPDNRNGDISPFGIGKVSMHGVRPVALSTLNDVAFNPVYLVNFAHFRPVICQDEWMHESKPMNDVNQPNTYVQRIDCMFNFICTNVREAGFVVHERIAA
jgi:hypothetical protein